MSLRGYIKTTKPALWKLAQDEADELSGVAETRRQDREAARRAAIRADRKRALERKRHRTPKPRARIAPVSKHRAGEAKAYRRRVPKYLAENPHCVACAKIKTILPFTDDRSHRSESVHHVRGRLGPLLLDERHWLQVCAAAHDWIHRHPVIARALRLLAQPGEWNKYEP